MCWTTGKTELAVGKTLPVTLTDMRLTRLEVLGSLDRIEAGGANRNRSNPNPNPRGQGQKAGAFTGEDTRRGGQKQAGSQPGNQSVNKYWKV